MGPFSSSNGYSYIWLVIDYVCRWVEAKAIKANDHLTVVQFLKSQISVSKSVISDQGSHFCNQIVVVLFSKYTLPLTIHKKIGKLKYLIKRLRICCSNLFILIGRIGVSF